MTGDRIETHHDSRIGFALAKCKSIAFKTCRTGEIVCGAALCVDFYDFLLWYHTGHADRNGPFLL